MGKLATALLSAVFVLGIGLAVYAQETGGYTITGNVVSIDPTGKTIVITTTEGEKTVIFQEGTKGLTEVKPGMAVEITCIDVEGKACAKEVKVISAAEAGRPTHTFEGEVVSIDPEGKTVVIKNPQGEQMTISIETATVEKVTPMKESKTTEEMVACEPMPVTLIKPGTMIRADCFDSGGKFCASRVMVISPEEAGKPVPGMEVVGEVSSIDPEGKSIVVKTVTGEKTLYYQKSTTGAAMGELEVGKKVKAYCLDVEGKTCIRDIKTAE